ncbi:apolipoprotein D-like [Eurosta solidaginis]|uniref:apolipoprotein D-like n=1 Tax=Eurosta solidaginis TaxID=178769 RepID=UPI00353059EE
MLKPQFTIAYLSLLVFLTSSNLVAGQVSREGECPKVEPMENFSTKAYLGKWYVYSGYPFANDLGARCQQVEFTAGPNANTLYVTFTQINASSQKEIRSGTAKVVGSSIQIRYDGTGSAVRNFDYVVLGADYENFSVIYNCSNNSLSHAENLWIRTRKRNPNKDIIKEAEQVIKKAGLSLVELKIADQADCN